MYSEKSNISNKLNNYSISYVNSEKSRLIDEELMGQDIGYSIDQLMEIAGLSVALSIHDVVKNNTEWNNVKKILNISGPGSKN
jgi:NAD(P)H-hydrate repair Nnr-like enzyme with NAD(P)H-hydrate epimerase domain